MFSKRNPRLNTLAFLTSSIFLTLYTLIPWPNHISWGWLEASTLFTLLPVLAATLKAPFSTCLVDDKNKSKSLVS